MRKLNTSDVFKVARIIKNANVKDNLIEIYKSKDGKDIEALGLDIIFTIIESCSDKNIEGEFYNFLAGVAELEEKEIAELELNNLVEILKKLASENDLAYFFKLATQ